MSAGKLSSKDPSNPVKPDDGNDPFQIFVQNAARRSDAAFHGMPLIYNFGLSELPGLTFFSPLAFQPTKCDKCSREFCSPINYRRHIRTHLRSLKVDKESHKNRDLLGAFWDKISLEEAGKLVSFDDISIEGISGSVTVNALASFLHMPGVLFLPQLYRTAGTTLLDIVQAKSSRLPISSQDLFSILDDASENTFLCAVTAESVQRFVIEAGAKEVLQLRNLIASTSLLFEQKLVKAWLAKLEAEALRFQQILVEEEEVTQKRQALTLERNKKKNIRKKEQKARGQSTSEKRVCNVGEKTDNNDNVKTYIIAEPSDNFIEGPGLAETSTLRHFSRLEQINFDGKKDEEFIKAECDYNSANTDMGLIESVGYHEEWETDGFSQPKISTWQVVPKSYRRSQVASLGSQNTRALKLKAEQKQEPMNTLTNVGKVWVRKSKITTDVGSSRASLTNIAAKGGVGVSSRTTLQHALEKSENDVASSGASWKNIASKGADGAESSRTTLQNVVAKSGNNVKCSEASWKDLIAKGGAGVASSRTLQHVVPESANDIASSEASWKNIVTKGAGGVESSRTILKNVAARSALDVASLEASWKNTVTKVVDGAENSRTILENIFAKTENDVVSSEASWKNIVTKGADDAGSSRTIMENVVSPEASWKNIVTKGADGAESSRTILENVVAKNANDVVSSKASGKTIDAKGADGVGSSRTILKNVVAKSENDVAEASWKNIVTKGADIVENDVASSRTNLESIVAKNANDVASSEASWKTIVTEGADGIGSSRTILENVVSKSENDVSSSEASWKNIVTNGANDVESSRTILKNVVAESENDEDCPKSSWKSIVSKVAVGVKSPKTTLHNIVAKSANDVESSRASLQNMVAEGAESSRTNLQTKVVKGANDVESGRANSQNIVEKNEKHVESSRTSLHNVAVSYIYTSNNDLYIGSTSAAVRSSMLKQHASPNSSDKCEKLDSVSEEQGPAIVMSRDVCDFERRGDLPVEQVNQSCGKNAMLGIVEDQVVTSLQQSVSNQNDRINNDNNLYKERNVQPEGSAYSSFDARAFLAQRWKDAIASDHVKLVLSPEPPCDADGRKVYKLADAETPVSSSKKIDKENSKQDEKGKGANMMKYNQ